MINLSKEQKILLNLLSISISNNPESLILPSQDLESVDWTEVLKESVYQAVTLSTLSALKHYKNFVPEKVYLAWKGTGISILKNNLNVLNNQAQLIEILDKNNVNYCIIKGSSASNYYPNPDDRTLGDIDFLIEGEKRKSIEDLLKANGYNMWDMPHPSHSVFTKGDAHVEMHFEVAGLPNNDSKEYIKKYLKPATQKIKKETNQFGTFNAPNELYHGIIILLHMQHHMQKEGLGLRHVCDWACYLSKTYKMPYFKQELLPFLREIGLYKYAQIITEICVKYLGVAPQDWMDNKNQMICEELMLDILSGGNFGFKDKGRSQSAHMIAQKGEKDKGAVGNAFRAIHRIILTQYPIVKKLWLLYPIIYGWKIIKYLFLTLIGKRKSVFKLMSKANERKDVYSKLEIFAINKEKENNK